MFDSRVDWSFWRSEWFFLRVVSSERVVEVDLEVSESFLERDSFSEVRVVISLDLSERVDSREVIFDLRESRDVSWDF